MKKLLSVLAFCSVMICSNAIAHSDHGIISGQAAVNIVNKSIPKMTFKEFGFEVGKLTILLSGNRTQSRSISF
ncbi:DUF6488 family protein [Aliiglaciecola sp. LCG003]|uniref:DUF6488 family protein n=1 Tax=Aliiglaciecola sp. LCG003 TaxID=3053655 RepID=UPI0025725917|nr:DUF6488 family protein [Aliiglaciecola sp. LCG003]WJG09216.1 DUF6488 family protein [Aliiglaciecola sp. LCG003]